MDDWSQSSGVVILINLLWPIIVYNDTLFIIFWVISKVKFEDGVTFQGIPMHGSRWCSYLWSLKFEDVLTNICIFSLFMNFILPTILSIQMTLMSLKNLSDRANLEILIYILLSLLFLVSHLLENWKKIHLQNPLNKYEFSSNSFSFSSMSLSRFFVFLNKTTQEKS